MFVWGRLFGVMVAFGVFAAGPSFAGQENWFIFGKRGASAGDQAHAATPRRPAAQRREVVWPPRRGTPATEMRSRARQTAVPRARVETRRKPAPARRATTAAAVATTGYRPPAQFQRQTVDYSGPHDPGTVIVDTRERLLYHVHGDGTATRYGVGVGRAGFEWSGTANIGRKSEWPDWRPPKEMIAREAKRGRNLPEFVPGGPKNPLGARALYLYQNGRDTLYRIHGTNNPKSIGLAMSSGCIRMMNDDVTHLYSQVGVGTRVVVR